jgi:hypothetical protein
MEPETAPLNDAVETVADPVLRAGDAYEHIMALHFDPQAESDLGVVRCIESRAGQVHTPGFVDRSQLHLVDVESPYTAEIGPRLEIDGSDEVVAGLAEYGDWEFLGFEDPTVWRDGRTGTLHLYFTIPFHDPGPGTAATYLGHASGPDLRSLEMTDPVLGPRQGIHNRAKELVVAPPSGAGHRHNLVESNDWIDDTSYSVLRTATAGTGNPGGPWEYGDLVLHPAREGLEWCGGHVSPGPFLPRSFVDVGDGKRACLLNGREANRREGERARFGTFSVGLMVYDYERGAVEWVSEEPLIRDPSARTITFASAFQRIDDERALVYAHVDDSAVRAYRLAADAVADYLP